jgi:hypothetical protein
VCVPSEFVVEYFTRGDGDGFEDISSHEENNQVANGDMCPRVKDGLSHGRAGRFGRHGGWERGIRNGRT